MHLPLQWRSAVCGGWRLSFFFVSESLLALVDPLKLVVGLVHRLRRREDRVDDQADEVLGHGRQQLVGHGGGRVDLDEPHLVVGAVSVCWEL